MLLEAVPQPEPLINAADVDGCTALHMVFTQLPDAVAGGWKHAVLEGRESITDPIELVSSLCAVQDIDVSKLDCNGDTALLKVRRNHPVTHVEAPGLLIVFDLERES